MVCVAGDADDSAARSERLKLKRGTEAAAKKPRLKMKIGAQPASPTAMPPKSKRLKLSLKGDAGGASAPPARRLKVHTNQVGRHVMRNSHEAREAA